MRGCPRAEKKRRCGARTNGDGDVRLRDLLFPQPSVQVRGDPDRPQRTALSEDVLRVEHRALGCREAARDATIRVGKSATRRISRIPGTRGRARPSASRAFARTAPARAERAGGVPFRPNPSRAAGDARVQVPRRFRGNLAFGQNNGFMRFESVFGFGFGGAFTLFADCLNTLALGQKKARGVSRMQDDDHLRAARVATPRLDVGVGIAKRAAFLSRSTRRDRSRRFLLTRPETNSDTLTW